MAFSTFASGIVHDMPDSSELRADMLAAQGNLKGCLNSKWAENCHLRAADAVLAPQRRTRKSLYGKFKNIGAVFLNERVA